MQRSEADFTTRGGSVHLITPKNSDARQWLDDKVGDETTWWGASLAVEHRYIESLVIGILDAGFSVWSDDHAGFMWVMDGTVMVKSIAHGDMTATP
jgi:hypothetical protein